MRHGTELSPKLPSQHHQFGPFEFDVRTGDLRKHGVRIRLPEQASQILVMLLEQPGEVVLRSAIRQKLWPGDTVVEFDQSINQAIKRLRAALSDSADAPRYVETEAKRGYRFIAEVRQEAPQVTPREKSGEGNPLLSEAVASLPEPGEPDASPDRPEEFRGDGPGTIPAQPEPVATPGPRRTWLWLVAAVGVALAVGTWLHLFGGGHSQGAPWRAVPLTALEGQQNFPAFSPDGEKVAFSVFAPPQPDGQAVVHIYVKSILSGELSQVTSAVAEDRFPSWSPNGREIAFQRDLATGTSLMIVPAGGGEARKVADMGFGLSWSPKGDEIAYVAPYPPAGNGGILIRSLKTGAVRQLTAPQPRRERSVAWSPDGKQIAFSRELGNQVRELFVVPVEGGEARQITFRQSMGGFAWTADSRELVFDSNQKSVPNLWRIGAAGGTPEQVTQTASSPAFPAISLRGNRLVYSDYFVDSNIWRYELPAPGSEANVLAKPSEGRQAWKCLICSAVEDNGPRFSPDGRRIAFASRRDGSEELWTANADGSEPRKLTSLGARTGSPRWSPDGRWIAFDSTADGNAHVYVIGAGGGPSRRLTTDPAREIEPSWSHDGQWLYFASDRGAQSHIWKVPFVGGAARQVTQGDGGEAMESADGKRLYYFRRQRQDGLWSMPSGGGLEEQVPELSGLRHTRAWTVRSEGIYFYQMVEGKPQIRFLDFATRRISTVLVPEKVTPGMGLDISPDGRTLLYGQVDRRTDELMMIENFR